MVDISAAKHKLDSFNSIELQLFSVYLHKNTQGDGVAIWVNKRLSTDSVRNVDSIVDEYAVPKEFWN